MPTLSTRPLDAVADQIHSLTAQFRDRETELAFRRHVHGETRRHLVIAFLVAAALILLFALPDFASMGAGREFTTLLVMRIASATLIAGYALASLKWPDLAQNYPAITALLLVTVTGYLLIYFLRPDVAGFLITVYMIMIIGLYLLIPNLLWWNTLVAAYMVASSLVALGFTQDIDLLGLSALFVVYLLPALIGFFIARRLQMLRRSEFALLLEAEEHNAELEREVERRRALEAELKQQAATDPLTGLHNRRGYELLFDQEFKRARRHDTPLAMAILDLDRFKRLNDTYGHGAGDQVLRSLAHEWSRHIREPDILGRLGGEEFVVLMPDTQAADALEVMERLRTHTERTPRQLGAATVPVTVTIGVTELAPADTCVQDIIARADEALYKGKDAGRNQVMLLRSDDETATAADSQQR